MLTLRTPLRDLLIALACDDAFLVRLAWWLRRGFSTERWIQFELAFRLSQNLGPRYLVDCERGRTDIVILDATADASATPLAGVEFKWQGNWWVKDAPHLLANDIAKIRATTTPSIALMLAAVVDPEDDYPELIWMHRQIRGPHGSCDRTAMWNRMRDSLPGPPEIEIEAACGGVSGFTTASLWMIGYANGPGKHLLQGEG